MRNAAGDGVEGFYDQNAAYRAVVSDLVSLVEHVQNSLRLIEQTIARETSPEAPPGSPESSTNIIVLDGAITLSALLLRPLTRRPTVSWCACL
jgi:hypothetical protein